MDTKKFFTSMLFAVAIMLAVMYFFKSSPSSDVDNATKLVNPIYSDVPEKPMAAEDGAKPETKVLGGWTGSNDCLLAVTINNITAGIDKVEFNPREYASSYDHSTPLTLFQADAKLGKPFSTIGIHITRAGLTKEFDVGIEYNLDPYRKDLLTVVNDSIGMATDAAYRGELNALHDQLVAGGPLSPAAATTLSKMIVTRTLNPVDPDPEQRLAKLISKANNINLLSLGYVWKFDEAKTTATDAYLYATIEAYLTDNDKTPTPVARITKHFHLDPKSYEISVSHTVENLLPAPISVRIDQLGAPALLRDDPRADDRFFHGVALNSAKKIVDGGNGYNMIWGAMRKDILARIGTGKDEHKEYDGTIPIAQMGDFANNPQLWVAASNRFFAIITRPLPELTGKLAGGGFVADGPGATFTLDGGTAIGAPTHVAWSNIDLMALGGTAPAYDKPADDVAILRLTGGNLDVPAGKAVQEPLAVYLGPKKRDILNGTAEVAGKTDYATYQYIKLVQFNSCVVYSFCFVDQIGMVILKILDWISTWTHNYGVAIMILVVAVRAALHPLTRASQINMAKMGKQMRDVQPQLEAVKKRYADNKRKQGEETMRVYRENNINPAGSIMGCLPMLLQAPIWVALYSGLSGDVDLRHSVFIPGWINDLASPDKVLPHGALVLGHPVFTLPVIGDVYGLNLLPILIAVVFYFQMKINTATQPKPADDQQAQVQKMSQYMIFLFPIMLYSAPSGLNLYIFASTLAGIVDTYLVRKTLRKRGILAASAPLLPTHEVPEEKPE